MKQLSSCLADVAVGMALFGSVSPSSAAATRERIPINEGRRFTQGALTNVTSKDVVYEVRPVSRGEDRRERLAEATEDAAMLASASHPVLKPWSLPSGRSSRGNCHQADGNR